MPPRVLFVDDHEDTCDLVKVVLTRSGCAVSVASCASEALTLASGEGFDLYILDNRLPDSTGVGLLMSLREFDPHTPVLFYSGDGLEDDRRKALDAGAVAYLIKPTDPRELADTVSRLIREADKSSLSE
jgi:DNA-binding response OmpR family regulator